MTRRKATTPAQLARRASALRARYGITMEEYDAIQARQMGFCAICKRAFGRTRHLVVDHDHSLSGRAAVRGLLCQGCNRKLGWYEACKKDIQRYLRYPPARKVLNGNRSHQGSG